MTYTRRLVPDPPRKKKAGRLLLAGVIGSVAWLIAVLAGDALGWDVRDALGPLTLAPAVALMGVGIIGQFTADYARRPRA